MKVEAAVVPSLLALLAPLVTRHLQSQLPCLDLGFRCTTESQASTRLGQQVSLWYYTKWIQKQLCLGERAY